MSILFTILLLGVMWGILLNVLESINYNVFDPALHLIMGPTKKNRLVYIVICYIFMCFHRLVSWLPIWSLIFTVLWLAGFTQTFSYITTPVTQLILILSIAISGAFKTAERYREDYIPNKFLDMSIDQLIDEVDKSLKLYDKLSKKESYRY